ncbi:ATP-binding protein [Nonomuraea sp. NPDC050310]|uniref:sensor histidine kinase n=1 Tax=Nonomuraea sp. NPDC050310 TaxID=3154935 RepID=UPI0033F998D5
MRLARPAAAVLLPLLVALAAGLALRAWAQGFRYGGDNPFFVGSLAVATLLAARSGTRLVRRGERRVGRWLLATAGSLLAYLVSTALAVEFGGLRGLRDPLTQLVVIAHTAGYILPVALLQVCLIAAGARLGVVGRRGVLAGRVLLGYSAAFTVLAGLLLPVGEPYQDLRPVWPAGEDWGWMLPVPWMAGAVAGPVIMWRAVRRARGEARSRALMVAVVALAPIGTILFCVLSGLMAYWSGVLGAEVAEAGLAVLFSLPFVLAALGLAEAFGGPARRPVAERWTRLLAVLVGLPFAVVVVAASAIVGGELDAVLPVVLATLLIAAALTPLRRRLLRELLLRADPVRARTARLVRERGDGLSPARSAQEILREALDEPDLRLLLRLPEQRGWADVDGAPQPEAGVPLGESARVVGESVGGSARVLGGSAELAGEPTRVLGGPARVLGDSALALGVGVADLDGCLAELGPLIDRAVLEVAVRDQAARVEAAVTEERTRLERDLHDGVQGRLLALALDLKMAEQTVGGEARLLLTDAAESLTAAIGELRALAGGSAPDLLSRRGLRAALTDLTGRIPLPIRLDVPEARLPAAVETVAYLVICEAVTNALKHAAADNVSVEVSVEAGRATVTVQDDGRGGADLRAGTGLRGLAERVRSAGGHLVVSDRDPRGTLLEVTLPCPP